VRSKPGIPITHFGAPRSSQPVDQTEDARIRLAYYFSQLRRSRQGRSQARSGFRSTHLCSATRGPSESSSTCVTVFYTSYSLLVSYFLVLTPPARSRRRRLLALLLLATYTQLCSWPVCAAATLERRQFAPVFHLCTVEVSGHLDSVLGHAAALQQVRHQRSQQAQDNKHEPGRASTGSVRIRRPR
jgi:hypothetical protein